MQSIDDECRGCGLIAERYADVLRGAAFALASVAREGPVVNNSVVVPMTIRDAI